ncbi:hypothetical protein ACXZ9C_11110 [Streptococcus agalactiae]
MACVRASRRWRGVASVVASRGVALSVAWRRASSIASHGIAWLVADVAWHG